MVWWKNKEEKITLIKKFLPASNVDTGKKCKGHALFKYKG